MKALSTQLSYLYNIKIKLWVEVLISWAGKLWLYGTVGPHGAQEAFSRRKAIRNKHVPRLFGVSDELNQTQC